MEMITTTATTAMPTMSHHDRIYDTFGTQQETEIYGGIYTNPHNNQTNRTAATTGANVGDDEEDDSI